MLRKLWIHNYRSCLDTHFELQPDLSVLIGPNSSGKTNILNAILLLRRLLDHVPERFSGRQPQEAGEPSSLRASFEVDGKDIEFNADMQLYTDESNADVLVSEKQYWVAKDFTGNRKRISFPLWMARYVEMQAEQVWSVHGLVPTGLADMPAELFRPLVSLTHFVAGIRYYSASQFTNPSQCPVSFEAEKEGHGMRRGYRLHGHAKFLYDLYREYTARKESRYDQFMEVIGPGGIGLVDNISFEEISTSSVDVKVRTGGRIRQQKREKSLIVPKFVIGKSTLSPSQLSEGTFKTITLLLICHDGKQHCVAY